MAAGWHEVFSCLQKSAEHPVCLFAHARFLRLLRLAGCLKLVVPAGESPVASEALRGQDAKNDCCNLHAMASGPGHAV